MHASSSSHIYSISQLNSTVRLLLEQQIGLVWITAEISGLTLPASGHWYLTLKDNQAQVRAVMFRGQNRKVGFRVQNGQQVLIRARLTLYEPRGDYQLQIESMQLAGDGALQLQFEQLKQKLAAEGLFDAQRKKQLPPHVRRVGLITSATGAAISDVLSVLKRRDPSLKIILYPSAVQGRDAPGELCRAIQIASTRNECDLLLITRGGGSMEDLFCFNDETLARTIVACPLPIVSAVGHEIDFTIADFVADLRAPTPSAAAELISVDQLEKQKHLGLYKNQMERAIDIILRHKQQQLALIDSRMQQHHPLRRLEQQNQRLDEQTLRLSHQIRLLLQQNNSRVEDLNHRLLRRSPAHTLSRAAQTLTHLEQRLQFAGQHTLETQKQRLARASEQLHLVSPLATLGRGYAIAFNDAQQVIHSIDQIKAGDRMTIALSDGQIKTQVTQCIPRDHSLPQGTPVQAID